MIPDRCVVTLKVNVPVRPEDHDRIRGEIHGSRREWYLAGCFAADEYVTQQRKSRRTDEFRREYFAACATVAFQ